MKFFMCLLLLSFVYISCNQTSSKKTENKSAQDSTTFFPVEDYIQQQIKLVDSTPYFIYLIKIKNGKKDSMPINIHQFDSLVKPFLEIDISNPSIKKKYTETVFEDLTTQSYTLSYGTKDTSLSVQNMDVLLNRDDQQVKRIFINIFQNFGDSAVTQKLGWKFYHSCYINRIIQYKNGEQINEQNQIVWNDKD